MFSFLFYNVFLFVGLQFNSTPHLLNCQRSYGIDYSNQYRVTGYEERPFWEILVLSFECKQVSFLNRSNLIEFLSCWSFYGIAKDEKLGQYGRVGWPGTADSCHIFVVF